MLLNVKHGIYLHLSFMALARTPASCSHVVGCIIGLVCLSNPTILERGLGLLLAHYLHITSIRIILQVYESITLISDSDWMSTWQRSELASSGNKT